MTKTAVPGCLLECAQPAHASRPAHWKALPNTAQALALSTLAQQHQRLTLIITPDSQTAQRLHAELGFFAERLESTVLPDWETLPYDVFSPHQDIIARRLGILYRLPTQSTGVLIVPVATLLQRLAPRDYLDRHALILAVGERLDREGFRLRLEAAGYNAVSQVMEHGEFAVRGSLIDLFPSSAEQPYRIDLFDDDIDSIRSFDPETQRTRDKIDRIELLPAREFPLSQQAITRFRQRYRSLFSGDTSRSLIYQEVSDGHPPGGIEYYLPLFFAQTATLFDYLPPTTLMVQLPGVTEAIEQFWTQIEERYDSRRHDIERPLLPPAELFLDHPTVQTALAAHPRVIIDAADPPPMPPPSLAFNPRAEDPAAALRAFLDVFPGRVLLTVESAGRRELLLDTLKRHQLHPTAASSWEDFVNASEPLMLCIAPLEQGMVLDHPPLAVIAESQLFGQWVPQQRRRRTSRDAERIVRDLASLSIGAPVVHEDHGVARYAGLQRMNVAGFDAEYAVLEYAGSDKLYLPVAALHKLSRYTGASPEVAPLHKLGSDQWEKARRKAAEKIRDAAAELLELYARRQARPGHAFRLSEAEYAAFAAAFPFEETPDQAAAIAAVLADMRSDQPMDRVVCGDVGFGKTEVAMRAAFVAVQGGSQVAVLVPTTLLAQQHYQNFLDRFADWPVRIELLSRFRSAKQQQVALAGLAEGKVDILIGTHKLLQTDVQFQQLGLVIIDEEHRFGVRQKERLKALRAEVDMLTLTATPIPRTLNMALASLRDLSIIITPPAGRLAVKTFVGQWNTPLIREACQRELKRGGQVYFLHNDVQTIDQTARELADMVPEARIAVAHGQLRERELEQVMLDFYHQRCNLLVCSTIIESGIDVPNANTIIINRADKLGLAQLHQLRGRVGRSHHRAYCYLVTPHPKSMTADARKRIEALESLEDLGAGFMLANHDLEIRGAGELLGEGQSGQIHEIGFSLYMDMLERAVKSLKSGQVLDLDQPIEHGPEVDLQVAALIPEDYLPDVHNRLILYKRIANAASRAELDELQVEMVDRFGKLPESTKRLFALTALKLQATPLGVRKIEAGAKGARIVFSAEPRIDVAKLLGLIRSQPQVYKLDGQDKLRIIKPLEQPESRLSEIGTLLEQVTARYSRLP